MKTLTDQATRAIVKAVVPLHITNYDRGELNVGMWSIVLDFASYAGFETAPKLSDINAQIKDEWMKIGINKLEESRKAAKQMDEFAGGDDWSKDFEKNLKSVMAI